MHSKHKLKSCLHLAQAILERALLDIIEGDRYYQDAVDWLYSNSSKYLFDFLNICALLDLDPERIRNWVDENWLRPWSGGNRLVQEYKVKP